MAEPASPCEITAIGTGDGRLSSSTAPGERTTTPTPNELQFSPRFEVRGLSAYLELQVLEKLGVHLENPAPPPDPGDLLARLQQADRLAPVIEQALPDAALSGRYLPWDTFRFKNPPGDLTVEEWWFAVRLARRSVHRQIKHLRDAAGRPFSYALPDEILAAVDQITRDASGHITISEEVTNPATRHVAKEMLREGRAPRDRSERMIFNNYLAMQRIADLRDTDLTPELVCEIHRIVTDGTLENPSGAGRMQTRDSERIAVHDEFGTLLHGHHQWPNCQNACVAYVSSPMAVAPITICHRCYGRSPSTSWSATTTTSKTAMAGPPAPSSIGQCCATDTGSPSSSASLAC